ncbi:hypothetical protein COLO4_36663 [Corchorus olitorius]|uniref:Uncharacterized protein n=1 Tax=Corchorus olitorius TaxID=93759 RepID=A0A1R3G6U7_9ROSI|nr:hypothetical protein COLO4_36663 [Corchorus olitorius]
MSLSELRFLVPRWFSPRFQGIFGDCCLTLLWVFLSPQGFGELPANCPTTANGMPSA